MRMARKYKDTAMMRGGDAVLAEREPHLPSPVTCTDVAHAAEAGSVSGRPPATVLSDAVFRSMTSVMRSAAAAPCFPVGRNRCAVTAVVSASGLRAVEA